MPFRYFSIVIRVRFVRSFVGRINQKFKVHMHAGVIGGSLLQTALASLFYLKDAGSSANVQVTKRVRNRGQRNFFELRTG